MPNVILTYNDEKGLSDRYAKEEAENILDGLYRMELQHPFHPTEVIHFEFGNVTFLNEFRIAMKYRRISSLKAVYDEGEQVFDKHGKCSFWPKVMSIWDEQLDRLL